MRTRKRMEFSTLIVSLVVSASLALAAMIPAGCKGGGGAGAVPLPAPKAITEFSFKNVEGAGIIDENAKTISVTVPYGTNVAGLVAVFTTTGASVKVGDTAQASGTTPNDFTHPVAYLVTGSDGSTATYTVTVTKAGLIRLPRTGQVTVYGTGSNDDGAFEKGVGWPSPRFTVGAGAEVDCITDNLTGLIWVKSPDSIQRTWQAGLDYADGLTLCGFNDWRMPNRKELRSLVNYGQSTPSWLNNPAQGFSNVQNNYWTSTTWSVDTSLAWRVAMYGGILNISAKATGIHYVWPVRSGQ